MSIVVALILVFSMFEISSAQSPYKAYACAKPPATDGHHCILFDFGCNEGERILIRDVFYVFGDDPPGADCNSQNDECRSDKDGGCCTFTEDYTMRPFEIGHKYSLYKLCSWSQNCTGHRTDVYGTSTSSELRYECQPGENTAHMCVPTNDPVMGKTVNIIFDGAENISNNPAHCVCTMKMKKTSESYEISAPDLRLQSVYKSCSTSTSLSGLQAGEFTCDSKFISIAKETTSLARNITLTFQTKPEFIWIEAKAKGGGNQMIVECFADHQATTTVSSLPTTQSMETSPSSSSATNTTISSVMDSSTPTGSSHPPYVSTTSSLPPAPTTNSTTLTFPANTTIPLINSTVSYSSTTKNTLGSLTTSSVQPPITSVMTHVTTTTTVAESNGSGTMANHEISSDEFPIVAVIIPVVVLVCVGVGIMVWLKWRQRRQSGSKKHDKGTDNASQNRPTNAVQNKAYDKTDLPGNGPMKTTDNYIDLDQENTYTYIDHENAKVGLGKSNGTNLSSSNKSNGFSFGRDNRKEDTDYAHTYDTTNAGHNYADIESQSFNKGANIHDTSKIEYKSGNVENHDYIVLEPGNAVADESDNKSNETNNNGALEGNTYFILEPQTELSSNKVSSTVNGNLRTHKTAENEAQSNTYFVLEPQNPQTKPTTPQKTTTGTVGLPGVGKVNNQNYEFAVETPGNNQNYEFAFEPQDTYSSIDPDDVATQTLPENEYNVINMTGKATITRDPNYGTLDAVAKKDKEIEDSSEYSHIGQDTNKNKEMNDYMKGTLGTADKKGGGIEDSGDYSHIGKG